MRVVLMVLTSMGLLGLLFLLPIQTSAKDWHGITPLKSSRSDVEKKFGKSNELGGYEIDGQFVEFFYSSSDCANPKNCECAVGVDIVLRITVSLRFPVTMRSLGLKISDFKKTRDSHLLVYDYYSNDDKGVTYTVFREDNTITSINYIPTPKECKQVEKTKPH